MSQVDPQLVKTIADLVIEALSKPTHTADIRPPAGLCTAGGDPKTSENTPTAKPVTTSTTYAPRQIVPTAERPMLHGIVTSHRLEDAIASSPDKVAILAMDARLTPLAQDIVRANPNVVRRENINEQDATLKHLNYGRAWCWWTCCQCDAIQRTVSERSNMFVPLAVPRHSSSIAEAVMDADSMIRTGRVAGAILFVRQAAKPMCLANRRRSIRAILGNCDEAVMHGIHAIGANTLILEFPYVNYEQMSARVDMMLRSEARTPIEMTRFLANVEGAGL